MQFALQALPFSRHAQNDMLFGLPVRSAATHGPAPLSAPRSVPVARLPMCPPSARAGVRILRSPNQGSPGGRLLISGRMADVCAALNRLAFNEYACG